MSSKDPKKAGCRYSDPSSASLTPLSPKFARHPRASRAHSLSPQKRQQKQPLHIRMNLTETQMDKITDAFSSKVSSPSRGLSSRGTRTSQHVESTSPHKFTTYGNHGRNKYSLDSNSRYDTFSESTTFSDLLLHRDPDGDAANLAKRRQKQTPAPIQLGDHRRPMPTVQRPTMEHVSTIVSPLSAEDMYEYARHSHETDSAAYVAHPSAYPMPLNHCDDTFHPKYHAKQGLDESPEQRVLRSPIKMKPSHVMALKTQFDQESPLWSPFPFYFGAQGFASEKIGGKEMIGDKGWLERTDDKGDKVRKISPSKKTRLFDNIKKIAKDMTEFNQPGRCPQQEPHEAFATQQMTISLSAREQSLFYCELEYHLTDALNVYIISQLEKGRLVTDKLKKIGDAWLQQGRPRVVAFRYDLETQLELLILHISEFVFLGRRQGNPPEIAGLLHAMKVNARAMRIRTFCQPDSVIAKQLIDTQSLFNLLGVPKPTDMALAEITEVFKACVEREHLTNIKERKEARKSRRYPEQ